MRRGLRNEPHSTGILGAAQGRLVVEPKPEIFEFPCPGEDLSDGINRELDVLGQLIDIIERAIKLFGCGARGPCEIEGTRRQPGADGAHKNAQQACACGRSTGQRTSACSSSSARPEQGQEPMVLAGRPGGRGGGERHASAGPFAHTPGKGARVPHHAVSPCGFLNDKLATGPAAAVRKDQKAYSAVDACW